MQSNRTAGRASAFTVAAVDDAGDKIAATSAAWSLFDARGRELHSGAATYEEGDDEVAFNLTGAQLALPDGATSEGREIVITLETADGPLELRDYFVLVFDRPLALMENSLVTYVEALALRRGFGPTLDGWDAVDDVDARSGALVEAYERLMRLTFKVPFLDGMTHASSYAAYGTGTDLPFDFTRRLRLRQLSLQQFDALPDAFTNAVKRAQLIEANVILGGDVVGKKRRDGIVQETIGESSATFNAKPYLNLPISRQAYEEVQRYILFQIGVARG